MPVVVKGKISRNAGHHYGQVRVQRVEGVTADSTVWTADTICVTADGRVICIPANVVEGVRGPTADTTLYTADNTILTADGGVIVSGATDTLDAIAVAGGAVIDVAVVEAADAFDQADAISIVSADVLEPASALDQLDAVTDVAADAIEAAIAIDDLDAVAVPAGVVLADVAEAANGLDQLDADVVYAEVPIAAAGGRAPLRRPLPVYGVGYGILPPLWGEAHGVVGVAGKSAAQVLVRAAAIGACGQAGTATAVLKALAAAGKGAVGARGSGEGMIVKFSGTATGQQDDDEAAVIAFLLAA